QWSARRFRLHRTLRRRFCECRQDTVHAAVWFGQHQAGWRPAWSTLRVCRVFSNVLQIQFRPKTAFPTRVGLPNIASCCTCGDQVSRWSPHASVADGKRTLQHPGPPTLCHLHDRLRIRPMRPSQHNCVCPLLPLSRLCSIFEYSVQLTLRLGEGNLEVKALCQLMAHLSTAVYL